MESKEWRKLEPGDRVRIPWPTEALPGSRSALPRRTVTVTRGPEKTRNGNPGIGPIEVALENGYSFSIKNNDDVSPAI